MIKIKTEITDKGVIQTLVKDNSLPSVTINRTVNRGLASITNESLSLFVDDVLGNDGNSGLTANKPLATIIRAEQLIPDRVRHPVLINVEPHGGSGYTWPLFASREFMNAGDIWVNFPNFNEIVPSTGSWSSPTVGVIKSSGLAADVYMGKTLEMLSGDAAGDRRTVRDNTATDITLVAEFRSAPSGGDLYRIIEPASGNIVIPPDDTAMVQNRGVAENIPFGTLPINLGVHLVNAIIKPTDYAFNIAQDARMFFHGTELSSSLSLIYHKFSGQVLIGRDAWNTVRTPYNDSDIAWQGWGMYWPNAFPVFQEFAGHISGYIVAPRWGVFCGTHTITGRIYDGFIRSAGENVAYDPRPPTVQFGLHTPLIDRVASGLVTNTQAAFPAFSAETNGYISIGFQTRVESAGICVQASMNARVRILTGMTLTTGSIGFSASALGVITLNGTITVGTLTGAELSVGNTPTTASLASIAGAGDFLIESGSSDGSIIHRLT